MQRTLNLVQTLVARACSKSEPISLRFASEGSEVTRLHITSFTDPRDVIVTMWGTIGFFADDSFKLWREGEIISQGKSALLLHQPGHEIDSISLRLEREPCPTRTQLLRRLRNDTCIGLPRALASKSGADKISLYSGASQERVSILSTDDREASARDGRSYLFEPRSDDKVEFVYVELHGSLSKKLLDTREYLDQKRRQLADRYNFSPKRGLTVYSLFNPELFACAQPLANWVELKERLSKDFDDALRSHLKHQVQRLEARLGEIRTRRKLWVGDQFIGYEPRNEAETIILFERVASRGLLPNGIRLQVLEHSARDIDSICEFSPDAHSPSTLIPVEFEFELASFFQHGHDIRQTRLIACFSTGDLDFPYEYAGVTYELLGEVGSRRLCARPEHVEVHCLILSEIVRLE